MRLIVRNADVPISGMNGFMVGRYSATGYLDYTDWNYGTNRRILENDTREMYGDD